MYHVLEASKVQGAPLEASEEDLGGPQEAPGPASERIYHHHEFDYPLMKNGPLRQLRPPYSVQRTPPRAQKRATENEMIFLHFFSKFEGGPSGTLGSRHADFIVNTDENETDPQKTTVKWGGAANLGPTRGNAQAQGASQYEKDQRRNHAPAGCLRETSSTPLLKRWRIASRIPPGQDCFD